MVDKNYSTSNADQELSSRHETEALELLREEGGAFLRLPENATAADIDPDDISIEHPDDQTMIINMGPQHPSTHGVLRVMLELEGETVLRSKCVVGYLHTGMEKQAEALMWHQGGTNVTRMDYLSPMNNELSYCMAIEKLLDLEVPERAQWIRMLMSELQRAASHVAFLATNGNDLGATTMMMWGFREREQVLDFFEKCSGLRMNHNYIRPGGVAADLPPGWQQDVHELVDVIGSRLEDYDTLFTNQAIWQHRSQGVGVITPAQARALSATGPILRATGVEWDLRRDAPYLFYDKVDFDVVVGTYGDSYDRMCVRLEEVRQSLRICSQIIDLMPHGDYRTQDAKVTPPPRSRIDESMEALIHHFKLFTEGFKVPAGEVYSAIESPRGELGCYIVSEGGSKPWRMRIRPPSFINLQTLPVMLRGGLVADAVVSISSVDPILGEVDR